jgi:ATP-dependent Lon protease
MVEKKINIQIKNEVIKQPHDVMSLIDKKIIFFTDVVQKTIRHVQKNKTFDILGIMDVNLCIERLININKQIIDASNKDHKQDGLMDSLQMINNELFGLFKTYGTESLEDLLYVYFGNKITDNDDENDIHKFDILKKHFHPTGYKIINKKEDSKNKKSSDDPSINDKTKSLDCFDVVSSYNQFHMKVYGLKIYVYNASLKKRILIFGILDDVIIDLLNNKYILSKQTDIQTNLPTTADFQCDSFDTFIKSLGLKDYLLNNNCKDFYNKYAGYLSQINSIRQKSISLVVKEFVADDMFSKRNTLIFLLINSSKHENQYLAYLLYDLLSNETSNGGGNIDTREQMSIFDSFNWYIKQFFKQAMKKTIQYTNELTNFDSNKIPIEQQICLMNAPDSVKEKAMMKLKEVKSKSEDSGTKARQYLDGLLKIPFGVYKKEPILMIMDVVKAQFNEIYKEHDFKTRFPEIPIKDKYTSVEILKYLKLLDFDKDKTGDLKKRLTVGDKAALCETLTKINDILTKHKLSTIKIPIGKKHLKIEIEAFVDKFKTNDDLIKDIISTLDCGNQSTDTNVVSLRANMTKITDYMIDVKQTLDKSVYGHNKAKRQIERIIAQWINSGNSNTVGHVLGFEGNPGIGKTTLAKGLANCLKDENGVSRPFALIAAGGESNASGLVGHSYTYVGSNWGQLVQILQDNKCMNPVIVIDEIDKISSSENGKEITGIFTHLLDPSQNSTIQDKYFAGIDIDFSKVLFILSYNDVNAIDRVLLDRIHRVQFDSLSLDDKIVICKNHILPEVYNNVGLNDVVTFTDETLKFIIRDYTLEPGVRKLKEKLFDIVGEINLDILKNNDKDLELPINVTIEDIKSNYFKDKREVVKFKVHEENKVGLINALWANELSMGGVLPLQVSFIPSQQFLSLTLTGSLGDVMKESISVSLTNAWNLTNLKQQKELIKKYNDTKTNNVFGLHIHCPDISTSKDGPSATTAFTVLIYSLFNNIKIKHNFGITGETSFDYKLTEIGGLEHKIIQSIPSGVTEFIFPVENKRDFDKIMDKYKDNEIVKGIKFHCISDIQSVFELILEK